MKIAYSLGLISSAYREVRYELPQLFSLKVQKVLNCYHEIGLTEETKRSGYVLLRELNKQSRLPNNTKKCIYIQTSGKNRCIPETIASFSWNHKVIDKRKWRTTWLRNNAMIFSLHNYFENGKKKYKRKERVMSKGDMLLSRNRVKQKREHCRKRIFGKYVRFRNDYTSKISR